MIRVASTTTIPPSPATRRSQLLPFRKPPQTGRSAPQLSVVFLSVCYGKAERRAEPQRPASYRPKGHEGRGTHTGPDRSRHARVFEGAAVGGRGAGGLGSGTVAHLGMGLAARTWPGICRRLGVPASAVWGIRRHTRRDRRRLADRHGHHHRGLRPARASSTASATRSSCSGPTASRRRTSSKTSAASPPAPGAVTDRTPGTLGSNAPRHKGRVHSTRSVPSDRLSPCLAGT